MKILNDYCIQMGTKEYAPIMIGGMGTNISTPEMAIEAARLGGIGHISDAMSCAVSDLRFGTTFSKDKFRKYKDQKHLRNKSFAQFDLNAIAEATKLLVSKTMEMKKGAGDVFINLMEKLTINNPKETLKTRLCSALEAGINGISMGAGLHLNSFEMMSEHPRFRHAKLGIIVSSVRALKLFLTKSKKFNRLPDFVVVEGPLAGGHLGFRLDDWHKFDLKAIVAEVIAFINQQELKIPVIPAGGIFSGQQAIEFIKMGASAVQVATRFTIVKESGLPKKAKQEFFKARKEDIIVNTISPTGYPMRMLVNSPCIAAKTRPNCETYGYLLDREGNCSYNEAYLDAESSQPEGQEVRIQDKTCLCSHMRNYRTWTCGHYTYKLKDKATIIEDGSYEEPTTEEIFNDYLTGKD
ncbi:MAG: nitronate monooxygenase [Deltaproteobacteria bacterium]|nr:nitronate monooxygenase [Deltaproteobacteria bacterium]